MTGGYQVVAPDGYVYYFFAPYDNPVPQLAMSVTATTAARNTSSDAGFGVTCIGQNGPTKGFSYEFLALLNGRWQIERRNLDNPTYPTELATGSSPARPGSAPLSVEGACVSFPGSKTVRLILFINGHKAADLADNPGVTFSAQWFGCIAVAGTLTAVATSYAQRDLDS